MYINPKLRKTNITKLRLDDYTEEMARSFAEASGVEKAEWMRAVIQKYLEEEGCVIPCVRRVHLRKAG